MPGTGRVPPTPFDLWCEAEGDRSRYRALLREHGLVMQPGDPGYEDGVPVKDLCHRCGVNETDEQANTNDGEYRLDGKPVCATCWWVR